MASPVGGGLTLILGVAFSYALVSMSTTYVPPDPEKLSLEVGTPWVDRVYNRKSVPGFFVI